MKHCRTLLVIGAALGIMGGCRPEGASPSVEGVTYPFPTRSFRVVRPVDSAGRPLDPAARKFLALYERIHTRFIADSTYQAYRSDSLRHRIPPAELRTLGAVEEVIQVTRRTDGEEWEEDSIIYTYFDPLDVEAFLVKEQWEWDAAAHAGKVQTVAFAPLVQLTVEGITLRPFPLYWIDMADLPGIVGPDDAEWMRRYLYYTLVRTVQDPEYDF